MSRRNMKGRFYQIMRKGKEKAHNELLERILQNPLILNESGKIFLREEGIVKKIREPIVSGYTADVGLLYKEFSGNYFFLLIDAKSNVGISLGKWENKTKKAFRMRDNEEVIKKYFEKVENFMYDFIAVTADYVGKIDTFKPIWWKKPKAEYYHNKKTGMDEFSKRNAELLQQQAFRNTMKS